MGREGLQLQGLEAPRGEREARERDWRRHQKDTTVVTRDKRSSLLSRARHFHPPPRSSLQTPPLAPPPHAVPRRAAPLPSSLLAAWPWPRSRTPPSAFAASKSTSRTSLMLRSSPSWARSSPLWSSRASRIAPPVPMLCSSLPRAPARPSPCSVPLSPGSANSSPCPLPLPLSPILCLQAVDSLLTSPPPVHFSVSPLPLSHILSSTPLSNSLLSNVTAFSLQRCLLHISPPSSAVPEGFVTCYSLHLPMWTLMNWLPIPVSRCSCRS
jgi:hypothetical protein